MALLSREMYKQIEGKLHNRFRMREEVAVWYAERDDTLPADAILSRKMQDVSGGQTNSRADATASTAIKRAQPPKHIREAQRWLCVIDLVERRYTETPKGMFLAAYYDGTPKTKGRMQRVCERLSIEQSTAYAWRDEIVNYTALILATERVVTKF